MIVLKEYPNSSLSNSNSVSFPVTLEGREGQEHLRAHPGVVRLRRRSALFPPHQYAETLSTSSLIILRSPGAAWGSGGESENHHSVSFVAARAAQVSHACDRMWGLPLFLLLGSVWLSVHGWGSSLHK